MTATTHEVREVLTATSTYLRTHEEALRRHAADPVRSAEVALDLADGLDGDLARTLADVSARLGVVLVDGREAGVDVDAGAPDAAEVAAWVRGEHDVRLAWATHAVDASRRGLAGALAGLAEACRRVAAGFEEGLAFPDLAPDIARLHGSRDRVRAGLAALRENLAAWADLAAGEPLAAHADVAPMELVWRARERLAHHDVDAALSLLARALDAAGVEGSADVVDTARVHREGAWRLADAVQLLVSSRG